ncbi:hypothetical protein [Lysobacter xanthus]
MRFISTLRQARPFALTAVAVLSTSGAAGAEPPPYTQPAENFLTTHRVEDAKVTREVLYDHPVFRHHRICVEGPLPAAGFDARYVDIRLRRGEPTQLDVLLKPVVEPNGHVCALVSAAVAIEPQLTIEIRDVRQPYEHDLYYEGPLLAIPAKKLP